MNLPQHIIDTVERRWAAKLQKDVDAWRKRKRPQQMQEQSRRNRSRIVPPSQKPSRVA